MNLYLNQWNKDVEFSYYRNLCPVFSLYFRGLSELHSLLEINSSGAELSGAWDYCFPTQFGWGLTADWLEDNRELALSVVRFRPTSLCLLRSREEAFACVVEQCRRRFSRAARP